MDFFLFFLPTGSTNILVMYHMNNRGLNSWSKFRILMNKVRPCGTIRKPNRLVNSLRNQPVIWCGHVKAILTFACVRYECVLQAWWPLWRVTSSVVTWQSVVLVQRAAAYWYDVIPPPGLSENPDWKLRVWTHNHWLSHNAPHLGYLCLCLLLSVSACPIGYMCHL